MKNQIDLKNINIRTDLVIDDNITKENIHKISKKNITITQIKVTKELETTLKRKKGTYITIEFKDATNHEDKKEIERQLTKELKKFLTILKIKKKDEGLIIGLGNKFSTPDALGPKTISKILVTRHLFELGKNTKEGIRNISAITPNVTANTGIESYDIITGIIEKTNPKFLIIIDSLASSTIDRIGKTIQITDTGITPGSGVGNHKKELSLNTLKIPVISIGVPTVVESSIIVNDTINYLFKHISYLKNNYDKSKLIITHNNINNLNNINLTNEEKKEISGILGTLKEEEKISLINEVLRSFKNNMIVTPKEIDFLIENLSEIIANSLNKALHQKIN